jgi:hypothetical protein
MFKQHCRSIFRTTCCKEQCRCAPGFSQQSLCFFNRLNLSFVIGGLGSRTVDDKANRSMPSFSASRIEALIFSVSNPTLGWKLRVRTSGERREEHFCCHNSDVSQKCLRQAFPSGRSFFPVSGHRPGLLLNFHWFTRITSRCVCFQ